MDSRGSSARGAYRFVHTSDLRLDAAVRGIGMAPEAVRTALRDATLEAWSALVELAIEREAAFVIIAGGLFDADTPTLRACVALRDGLHRLRAHAIDAFIALTPADAAAVASLSSLGCPATSFAPEPGPPARVMRGGECLAVLHGTSGDAGGAGRLVDAVRRNGAGVEIGVLPVAPDDVQGSARLAGTGLDYWALGGSPRSAVLQERPWIVLPGSPQGRGLDDAERGQKGCMVVEVDNRAVAGAALAALDRARFAALDVDVGGCPDIAAMRRHLQRALERVAVAGDRLAVVEATLRGALAPGLRAHRLGVADELLAGLRRAASMAGAPVWWAAVRDNTDAPERAAAPPGDLRRIVSEQSEALRAPLPRSSFLAHAFAPLLQLGHAESDLEAQRTLVRDAAALALDMLGSEDKR